MAKKPPITNRPMVSSITARIKNTKYDSSNPEVATPEETVTRKRIFLESLDKATQTMMENLENGKISIETTADMERIMKLTLLMSGEADSIRGKSGTETTQDMEIEAKKLSMSKIEQILDLEDPEVKAMYEKLYDKYNELNDEESEN